MGDGGSVSIDAKALLYSIIDRLGRDNLRRIMISDSRGAVSTLIHSCIDELRSNGADDADTIMSLVTALLHYLLTEFMIQSERKVIVDDTMVDIVIPSMRVLRSNPENALVIFLARSEDTLVQRLERIYMLQPERKNVWIVTPDATNAGSIRALSSTDGRIYVIDEDADPPAYLPLSAMIDDIREFMGSRGIRPFNIIT